MKVSLQYRDKDNNTKHITIHNVDYTYISQEEPKTLRCYKAHEAKNGKLDLNLVYEKRMRYIDWVYFV